MNESQIACHELTNARSLRSKYQINRQIPITEYLQDIKAIQDIIQNGAVRTHSHKRLQILRHQYQLHVSMHSHAEHSDLHDQEIDIYNLPKVDNHIHLAAAFPPKMILDFFKEKLETNGDDEIEQGIKLKDIMNTDNITSEKLGIHATQDTFLRFDRFNYKYNLYNKELVRKVFLKTNNRLNGKYFGELTQRLMNEERNHTELRISIYGNDPNEWQLLAEWMDRHQIMNCPTNKWVIQMPRIYHKLKTNNSKIQSFQTMIDNFFDPIEKAILHPDQYPDVHRLLQSVLGFDSVDDETVADTITECTKLDGWTSNNNPPYEMYLISMHQRISTLNRLRSERHQPVFQFRPHAGESGDIKHLVVTYLVANHINHGIKLQENPALMYLYYLDQIGISMSPTSNHYLVLKYKNSPFKKFFECGLAVTLSTDDPMFFHLSDNPLLEEYIIARHMWDLDMVDLFEIASHSVVQGQLESKNWCSPTRLHFRKERLVQERQIIEIAQ